MANFSAISRIDPVDISQNIFLANFPIFTRDATHNAVMPQYVVCLSVRPSVRLSVPDVQVP